MPFETAISKVDDQMANMAVVLGCQLYSKNAVKDRFQHNSFLLNYKNITFVKHSSSMLFCPLPNCRHSEPKCHRSTGDRSTSNLSKTSGGPGSMRLHVNKLISNVLNS
jgi:hypothetical protein